jgi:hypothetical protein
MLERLSLLLVAGEDARIWASSSSPYLLPSDGDFRLNAREKDSAQISPRHKRPPLC